MDLFDRKNLPQDVLKGKSCEYKCVLSLPSSDALNYVCINNM